MSRKSEVETRRKPTQSRARTTLDAIAKAAAHILSDRGYEEASTNRIAEKAGVSIGSLYQYFPNKESIVNHLIDQQIGKHIDLFETRIRELEGRPLPELVDELLRAAVELFGENRKLRMALFQQIARYGAITRIFAVEDRVTRLLLETIRPRAGETRVKDPETAAFVLVQAVMGVVRGSVPPHREVDFEAMHRELRILVHGYLFGAGGP